MLIRLLRKQLRPYRTYLIVLLVLHTIQTAAALTLPHLNAQIINHGVLTGNTGYIQRRGVIMIGFALIQITFNVAAVYFGARIAMGFGRDLRRALFLQVTGFSAREVGAFGTPSLITRITNDVQQVQLLVVMTATMAVGAPISVIVGVIMAIREDIGLSIILPIAMPAAGIVLGTIVSRMIPAFRVMQERIDQINRVLREQVTGIRVVRAFVREPQEVVRFESANNDLTAVSLRSGRLMAGMFPTSQFIINMSSAAVLWLGASRIASGHMAVGSVVAYLSYLVQILMSVMMATFVISMIPRAAVSAARIQEVLDTDSTVVPPVNPVDHVVTHGALEFRDVGFHYPGAEHAVLSDISFATTAGQTTAIIGSTGAGKSTLVNLIPRLFDATSGSVFIDGVNVRELDPDLLWHSIGYVPQKPYLFSGTIASNLEYGKPNATEADMWEALEIAQADDFVRAMGGLEARIEQGGTNVSGGQRQRLAIARALIRKPEVYVFDDSFSALDLTTDAKLRAALAPFTGDAAVVIVAQRVSTISQADCIIVLEDGQIVGKGTHAELVAGNPTYAEIVQSQIGEQEKVA